MGLSTDTLLHQTDFSNLIEIVKKKNFKVSYCSEKFGFKDSLEEEKGYRFVFPMICFSEIPISSLHNHLYRYGDCLIGMKKEWANTKRLNQVHYYQKESVLVEYLLDTYNVFYQQVMNIKNKDKDVLKVFCYLEYQMAHSKNYSGKVDSKNFEDDDYFFAEEKEWRYVPVNEHKDLTMSIKSDIFESKKSEFQAKIGKKILPFEIDDIRFIILDSEEQKKEIAHILSELPRKGHLNLFTNDEVKHNFFGYKNTSMEFYQLKKENQMLREKLID